MDFDTFGLTKLWNRFRDDWIVTTRAAQLFFVAAIIALAVTPLVLGYADPTPKSEVANVLVGIFGAASPFAVFFIWIGMWRYWAHIDPSPKWARRLWFVILVLGFWCGSALYYFCVYLPQHFEGKNKHDRHLAATTEGKSPSGFASLLIAGWTLLLTGTVMAFAFPKAPTLHILHPLSICLVILTSLYFVRRLYLSGINRRRA